MKALKNDMKAVLRGLKELTKKTERIATKLDKLEKAAKTKPAAKSKVRATRKVKPAKKTVARKTAVRKKPAKKAAARKTAIKKPRKISASDTVLNIIKRSRKSIDTATLKKKTGFKDNNIRMIVYRLKKRGEIKSERKGVYVKA
jgi:hypothetical protein